MITRTQPEIRNNDHTTVAVHQLGADLDGWVATHRDELRATLDTTGGVLLRGLPVDIDVFHRVVSTLGGDLLEYTERSTPRSAVSGNIYTSTEYPADQAIPMHNENSYSDRWPRTLFFFCHTPPATGGATPIADSRAVLGLVPAEVRERFAAGVVYARTFRDGLGLGWSEAFQTDSPADVERYCAEHGLDCQWLADGELRTRHLRPATRREPVTGAEVWFNQANLFHASSLEPEVRAALLETFGEDGLPRNAYYAGGTPIPDPDIAAITTAYQRAALALPWQPGDVLMVNNMLMAHGRQPFTGNRRILVAMT